MRRPKKLKTAKQRAWKAISQYIRQKHAKEGIARCVTCDRTARYQEFDCGHFIHGLTYGQDENGFFVWEENLWPQCKLCNGPRSGCLDLYQIFMQDMYGLEFTDQLRAERYKPLKMKIDDFWEIEQKYKEKTDAL